jgi:hypothetical protein
MNRAAVEAKPRQLAPLAATRCAVTGLSAPLWAGDSHPPDNRTALHRLGDIGVKLPRFCLICWSGVVECVLCRGGVADGAQRARPTEQMPSASFTSALSVRIASAASRFCSNRIPIEIKAHVSPRFLTLFVALQRPELLVLLLGVVRVVGPPRHGATRRPKLHDRAQDAPGIRIGRLLLAEVGPTSTILSRELVSVQQVRGAGGHSMVLPTSAGYGG